MRNVRGSRNLTLRFALVVGAMLSLAIFLASWIYVPVDTTTILTYDNVLTTVIRTADTKAAVAAPVTLSDNSSAPNGVIIFLHGVRSHSYFVNMCLVSLEKYFLSCHPYQYPIRIFHENMGEEKMASTRAAVPSAKEVIFEDVSEIWKTLPHGISEQQMQSWTAAMPQFQGRGYRIMCRFWAGLVWQLPSMQQYEYYWRLDTDSILKGKPLVDPFVEMQQRQCEYGFNRLKGENPHTMNHLGESFAAWADEALDPVVRERVNAVILDHKTGKYWGPMFYNNFELGTMRLKTNELYLSLFRYLDERPPYGILRYRWGDAPIHTLGVYSALGGSMAKMCNFTKEMVPYGHAVKKPRLTEEGCSSRGNAVI